MLCTLLLESIDWSRQLHIYGWATDTPTHLRALLGVDEHAAQRALVHLDSAPLHQGTVTPSAVTCAEFVVSALDEQAIPLASTVDGLMAWLGELGASIDYDVSGEEAVIDQPLLEALYRVPPAEVGELFDNDDLMDMLLVRSVRDLQAYASTVVAVMKRHGAQDGVCAVWEKYAN